MNPNEKIFKDNIPKIKEILRNPNVEIYVIATPQLKELILKGENPIVNKLVPSLREAFLTGGYWLPQKKMIWEWIEGKLDQERSFILSICEIRVAESNQIIIGDKK